MILSLHLQKSAMANWVFPHRITLKSILLPPSCEFHLYKQVSGVGMWISLGVMILPITLWKRKISYPYHKTMGKEEEVHSLSQAASATAQGSTVSPEPLDILLQGTKPCHQSLVIILSSSSLSVCCFCSYHMWAGETVDFHVLLKVRVTKMPLLSSHAFRSSLQPLNHVYCLLLQNPSWLRHWGKLVLYKVTAETLWYVSNMTATVVTSFCCEGQPQMRII